MVKVKKDLTGQKFGKLLVIQQTEDYIAPSGQHFAQWLCECTCEDHTILVVRGSNLTNNHTQSCGCTQKNNTNMTIPKKNLVGMVFGRLTVLRQVENKVSLINGRKTTRWLCECSCDNKTQVVVNGIDLTQGKTKSCGCIKKDNGKLLEKENKYDISGEYGIIWSTNTNEEIYFDLEDAEKILKHCWSIDAFGYPSTDIDRTSIRMRVFLGFKWYDHHNRNKRDNRRCNLIPCTQQENIRNSSIRQNNTSGFIGVYLNKSSNKWMAQITINYKTKSLGRFLNKEDAIKARLKAEKQYFGEFAPQRHLFEEYGIN